MLHQASPILYVSSNTVLDQYERNSVINYVFRFHKVFIEGNTLLGLSSFRIKSLTLLPYNARHLLHLTVPDEKSTSHFRLCKSMLSPNVKKINRNSYFYVTTSQF